MTYLKLRNKTFRYINKYSFSKYFYKSYFHFSLRKKKGITSINKEHFFITAVPNPYAGIGHQLANWISGYWFSILFGMKYAHTSFSTNKWDVFLGFKECFPKSLDLIEKQQLKEVRLPLFDESRPEDITLVKSIICSYSGEKILFVLEQDQFYRKQYQVRNDLQNFFYGASARIHDNILFDPNFYNIAIHIRRGDVNIAGLEKNPNLKMRWQSESYFIHALETALEIIETNKKIRIYLFSQGDKQDFKEFNHLNNVIYCLQTSAVNSFANMVFADALVTSKSSFSYKPALLNRGLKFCPANFWHSYPESDKSFILLDDDGMLN